MSQSEVKTVRTVAVVGASRDRGKFGNKAVRAFAKRGFRVVPIHPAADEVEGLRAYPRLADVPFAVDIVSMYVPPAVGERLVEEIGSLGRPEVWLNPGSESPALEARAAALGLRVIRTCSILAIGESPAMY